MAQFRGSTPVPVFLAAVVLLAACAAPTPAITPSSPAASTSAPASASLKRITAVVMSDPTAFSTAINPTGGAGSQPGVDSIELLLNAGLATYDNQGALQAQLAETVPTLDNGLWKIFPDGHMETTWKIRQGTTWHDGVPLTSADLAFTAQLGLDGQLPLFTNPIYALIDSVQTPDPSTVTVVWKSAYVDADQMFTRLHAMPLPQHLLAQPYEADKNGFSDLPYWGEQFVGAGPFKLKELVHGSYMIVAANDQYVRGRPKIDEIEIKFTPDANALITTVLANAAELTLGARISLDQAVQVRDRWTDGRVDFAATSWLVVYPQFINPDPPVQLDVRFRQALQYATDRQQIVDSIMLGITSIADSTVSPNQADYQDVESAMVRYPYDVTQTARLMTDLGYTRQADGFYHDAAGQKLTVEARATDQLDYQPKALAAVADYWQQAGIGVDQIVVPNQRVADREYRQTRPGFEVLVVGNDPENFANFRSSAAPVESNGYVGLNRSRYQNADYDTLVDKYFQTIPRPERIDVLRQIVHTQGDQLVFMGLSYVTSHTAIGNRLKNVTGRGPNSPEGWNAVDWDI